MIDTIRIYREVSFPIEKLEILRNKFKFSTYKQKYNDEMEVEGCYENMHIKISQTRVVITGSLNVFSKGSNVKVASISDLYNSVEMISEFIGIVLMDFIVTRVDMSINILSDLSIEMIKQTLTVPQYLNLIPFDSGISYKNSSRMLCFYDKIKQTKSEKVNIPLEFRSREFIRVEYRLMKANVINSVFKTSRTTLIDLFDKYELLQNFFKNILVDLKWSEAKMQNIAQLHDMDFKVFLMHKGLEEIGGIKEGYDLIEIKKLKEGGYRNKYVNYKKLLEELNTNITSNEVTQQILMFKQLIKVAFDYDKICRDTTVFR